MLTATHPPRSTGSPHSLEVSQSARVTETLLQRSRSLLLMKTGGAKGLMAAGGLFPHPLICRVKLRSLSQSRVLPPGPLAQGDVLS